MGFPVSFFNAAANSRSLNAVLPSNLNSLTVIVPGISGNPGTVEGEAGFNSTGGIGFGLISRGGSWGFLGGIGLGTVV